MKRASLLLPVPYARVYAWVCVLLLMVLFVLSTVWGKQQHLLWQLPALLSGQADGVSMWLFWQLWLPRALIAVGVGAWRCSLLFLRL